MSDMYTTLERSIQQTLRAACTAAAVTCPIYVNQVDKKLYKDSHKAISIMKTSDTPDLGTTGGQSSHIDTPVNTGGHITSYSRQEWPDGYLLLYTIEIVTDNGDDLRVLENVLRSALRPRTRLLLWDSVAQAFSTQWVNFHYAGYINRDVPSDSLYWRVQNIRFETFNFVVPPKTVPAITHITVTGQQTTIISTP